MAGSDKLECMGQSLWFFMVTAGTGAGWPSSRDETPFPTQPHVLRSMTLLMTSPHRVYTVYEPEFQLVHLVHLVLQLFRFFYSYQKYH